MGNNEWLNRLVQRPKTVFFLVCALMVGISFGVGRLSFSADYRMFFGPQNPNLQAFEALQNTYTKNDTVLFIVSTQKGTLFTPEHLATIEALTEAAWQLPYSIRVDSISNFQHTYAEQDDLVVEDLVYNAQNLSPAQINRIQDIALSEPLLVDRLISPNGQVTGVNVTIHLPGINQVEEVPLVVEHARTLEQRFKAQYPNLDFRLSGVVLQNNAFSEFSQSDLSTLVPLMFLIIMIGVGWFLKSAWATGCIAFLMIMSILPAMGLAGWLGIQLSPASVTAPTMIMTLAVAHGVHLLSSFYYQFNQSGQKAQALLESLRINFQPVMLTSMTTILGFLSLNFSDSPPFHDLGNIVAMGVFFAFILAIGALPALVLWMPISPKKMKNRSQYMAVLAKWVIEKRNPLFWVMGLVIALLISFVPKNQLNDVWINYFDTKTEFRQNADYLIDHLTGLNSIHYSIGAQEEGGISSPAYLQKLDAFSTWLRDQPEVIHVNTVTDIFKRLNKNLHQDALNWYKLPDSRELAAQYLLLYELSLPYGLDLNDQINVKKSATRIHVTLKKLSTNELLAFEEKANTWLTQNTPSWMHAMGTGPDIMFGHIGYTNIRSMLKGTTIALLLISFILCLAFRSIKFGVISMVPNLIPLGLGFGVWGILVGELGLSLSVVAGMTLGIIVDDTIHFLSKYLRAKREQKLNTYQAVEYAFKTVGPALWITTCVLIVGFGILAFSSFYLNSGMGLLTAITIALALCVDFLFLPPLLMKFEERKDAKVCKDYTLSGHRS